MSPATKPGRGFAARIMTLQFAVLGLLIVVVTIATIVVSYNRVFERAENTSLAIARTVAASGQVREEVARLSALETLDLEELRAGPLQRLADDVRVRAGADFVAILEDRGLRLAHPNPDEIGKPASTDPVALRGVEAVLRERGSLGDSVRAKVPVYAPGSGQVVGQVSVGVVTDSLTGALMASVSWILLFAALAATLAIVAGRVTVRRLKAQTLGLEPAEMAQLLRDQDAVLYGVEDGVIGIGRDGRISVRNKAARLMLGLPHRHESADIVGQPYAEAGLPPALVAAIDAGEPVTLRLETDKSALVATVHPVLRENHDLGKVVLLRDVTTIETLGSRLDAVETMAGALRAQRHEFANRLHTISGLLHNGNTAEAQEYLGEVIESGPVREPVQNLEAIDDTYLRAFLGAKGVSAHERGVVLRVGEESALYGKLNDAQDAIAVLGNLIDNALSAAVEGPAPRWVEVDLLGEGNTLHIAVADSGAGVPAGMDVFAEGVSTRSGTPDQAHGHGVGLPLIRRLARTHGGDVWIADPGGRHPADGDQQIPGGEADEATPAGAVFAARLPGVLTLESTTPERP